MSPNCEYEIHASYKPIASHLFHKLLQQTSAEWIVASSADLSRVITSSAEFSQVVCICSKPGQLQNRSVLCKTLAEPTPAECFTGSAKFSRVVCKSRVRQRSASGLRRSHLSTPPRVRSTYDGNGAISNIDSKMDTSLNPPCFAVCFCGRGCR